MLLTSSSLPSLDASSSMSSAAFSFSIGIIGHFCLEENEMKGIIKPIIGIEAIVTEWLVAKPEP